MTIEVKRGDTHDVDFTVNVDLSAATVRGLLRGPLDADTPTLTVLTMSVVDGPGGKARHALTGSIPDGEYNFELEIVAGGRVTTAPTVGYLRFIVHPDLNKAAAS